jgi:DNA polymerase III epsilon subunit-like protein
MLIIYDTETTGLVKHPNAPLAKQPRMIEFGAIALSLKNGKAMKKFKQLVNPGEPLTDEITKITGITNDDLKDAPSFEKAWTSIFAFIKPATMMLAHNEPFDRAIVDYELKRANKTFVWPTTFCTISLYRDQFGYDPKLTQLYKFITGKELDQKHRALSDVEALVEIVQLAKLWKTF